MASPRIDLSGLEKPKPWEYALRFVFGGAVTVGTGLVGKHYGPAIGGMCLAFPSILPASLTLVRRHDGRRQAVDDARGARLGTLGLAAFAATVALLATRVHPVAVLALATLAWAVIAVAAWSVAHARGAA